MTKQPPPVAPHPARLPIGFTATLALLMAVILAGCAGQSKTVKQSGAIFYPPPPDPPRLQFLTSFSNARDWTQKTSSFAQFVTGASANDQALSQIRTPYGLAVYQGRLYVCDVGAHAVHIIDFANKQYRTLGDSEKVRNPVNIAITPDGMKYICDTRKRTIVVFDAADQYVRDLGDPNKAIPGDVLVVGDELIVADMQQGQIQAWSKDGQVKRVIAYRGPGPNQLRKPTNLALMKNGDILVADTESSIIKEFTLEGVYVRDIGRPGDRPGDFARPKGMAVDDAGRIYVADAQWEVVQVFDPKGQLLLFFGGSGPDPQDLGMPAGLAIDTSSLDAFQQFVDPNFKPQYLLFIANQFGKHKITVLAFGEAAQ